MSVDRFRFENQDRYTGSDYEYDLVGKLDAFDPTYQADLKRMQNEARKRGYQTRNIDALPFREAVDITRKHQPWDPTNPTKDFAKELRLAVAEKFGLEDEKDLERLKFFTAVGGPLDAHKIDCFIAYEVVNKDGKKEYIVSYDITKNPNKDSSSVADLVITGDIPDPTENEDEYLKTVDNYAEESINILKKKMAQREEGFRRLHVTA